MSNFTHFKVLLKKNLITLKRKWGFLLFFIMLPIVTLGLFSLIVNVMSKGTRPEGHNFDCRVLTITFYRPFLLKHIKFWNFNS